MSGWTNAIDDEMRRIDAAGPARNAATFREIIDANVASAGLSTAIGVTAPFRDAFTEAKERYAAVTGQSVEDAAAARSIDLGKLGIDGQIAAIGGMIDSLPDAQQKILSSYRDVRGRARQRAAEIEQRAAEVEGVTYGVDGAVLAFGAGVARQMVDPVNLATAPLGPGRLAAGAGIKAIAGQLVKEGITGAATQAAQSVLFINPQREKLGLEPDTLETALQAGVGQAAFAGMFMAAGAALRRMRTRGETPPAPAANLAPEDFEELARQTQRNAALDRMIGDPVRGQAALDDAARVLETGAASMAGRDAVREAVFDIRAPRTVRISDALEIATRYQIADLKDIKISHSVAGEANPDFPQMLQPRDRGNAASLEWLNRTASRLDPEQLGPAPTAQQGAPIVAPDGIVESGNGRALLVSKAYESFPDKAAAYRDYIESLGFDTGGMERPILIRRRETELDAGQRITLTRDANVSETAALAPQARAKIDAGKIDDGLLASWGGTKNIDTLANTGFIRAFSARAVAATELNDFVDADGRLTPLGAQRVRGALVARAWREEDIIAKATGNNTGTSVALIDAMIDTAPDIARLRAAIEEGRISKDYDLVTDLVEAFRLTERARTTNRKLTALLDQTDIETGAVRDSVRDAVKLFFHDAELTISADAATIAERIRFAVDHAMLRVQDDLFGDVADRGGLLRAARLADTPIDEHALPALDQAKARSEAAAPRPAPAPEPVPKAPAALPPEIAAAEQRLLSALGETDPDARLFDMGDVDEAGEPVKRSARETIKQFQEQAAAAAELRACVTAAGGA